MVCINHKILLRDSGGGVVRKILPHAPNLMTVELHFDKASGDA